MTRPTPGWGMGGMNWQIPCLRTGRSVDSRERGMSIAAAGLALFLALARADSTAGSGSAKEYFERGLAEQNGSNLAAALADYNRALEIDPKNALAYNNRGLVKQV